MRIRNHRRVRVGAVVFLVVTLGACGEKPASAPAPAPSSTESTTSIAHIHGLGINPLDDALIVATHSGLFRLSRDATVPQRIGDRQQDTMGFTAIAPDTFLGSGHPDPREGGPPSLGLIRSSNAGVAWKSLSLEGEADFHILRSAGPRVYGVNATDGRLFVSDDGGLRWQARVPPAPFVDLVVDPSDHDRIVASSEQMLFVSSNAGRSWQALANDRAGLLVWPTSKTMYLIDGSGAVHVSRNTGRSWREVGQTGGSPVALTAARDELFVALEDHAIEMSTDGGRTWSVRTAR